MNDMNKDSDDLKDSSEPPLRLHDHLPRPKSPRATPISSVARLRSEPLKSRERRTNYKKRAEFNDQEFTMNLAEQLKAHRLRLGWSELELGRRAGVFPKSIIRLESGAIDGLHFDVVLRIVKALNLRIELVIQG